MAADYYNTRGQARRLSKTDPKAALALLENVLDQQWPKLEQYMAAGGPPGWLGRSAHFEVYWDLKGLRKDIAELRKRVADKSDSKDEP